jgi:nucleotidyltransferase substrate binding protein, HI0074 family
MDVKIHAFAETLDGFDYLVNVDLKALSLQLDVRIIDGLQNGIAQKFEYTTELCWKAIKSYLKEQTGIDESSPKKVIKAFYLEGFLDEESYLLLIQAIDDRNRLSHVYDEESFLEILARLPGYAGAFKKIRDRLKEASTPIDPKIDE